MQKISFSFFTCFVFLSGVLVFRDSIPPQSGKVVDGIHMDVNFYFLGCSLFGYRRQMLNMTNIDKKETSRLQIRIPVELKEQLEKVVKQNVMGMTNSKSLMVSMALVYLLNQMETTSIDDIYVNSYIPFLNNNNPHGDD